MSTHASWTVNKYDASVCITTQEINRKMLEVYQTTDNFPKEWEAKDIPEEGTAPGWKLKAFLGAPSVSFATDLKNGMNLMTGMRENSIFMSVQLDSQWVVHPVNTDITGVVFSLQSNMANIEHIAGQGDTVDQNFTVQALYADLNNPKIITNIASSYILTDIGKKRIEAQLKKDGEPDQSKIINALEKLVGKIYSNVDTYWTDVENELRNAKVPEPTIAKYKEPIIQAGIIGFKTPDNIRRSVATVLLDMVKNPKYNKNYIFGLSKIQIPKVKDTTGSFTPRVLRYSVFQDQKDSRVGTLNWNVMVDENSNAQVQLPDLNKFATAGLFEKNPMKDYTDTKDEKKIIDAPGVLILSFGKIIEKIIVAHAFDKNGLTADKWTSDPENSKSILNQDISIPAFGKVNNAKFSANECTIYPEVDKSRIRVDFVLKDIDYSKSWYDYIRPTVLWSILNFFKDPKYKATFSGYFTFELIEDSQTKDKKLKINYQQDEPNVYYQDSDTVWRVITDIVSLGLEELIGLAYFNSTESDVNQFLNSIPGNLLKDIINMVMLPGNAVFEFSNLDVVPLGLRTHLKYKDVNAIKTLTIQGGNDVIDRAYSDSQNNFYLVDTNNSINADGELTKWDIWAKNTLPVQLIIYRRNADAWSVVGKSDLKTPVVGTNSFNLPSRIPVKKGDFVGLYYPQQGSVAFSLDNGSWNFGNLSGKVLFTAGSTANAAAFSGSSNRTYSVNVK